MKKTSLVVLSLVALVLITGCGKSKEEQERDKVIGKWTAKFEMAGLSGTETYSFKKDGKCVRIVNTGSDISNDCTYEFNANNSEIKIIWTDKIDKKSFSKFTQVDDKTIIIGTRQYSKVD